MSGWNLCCNLMSPTHLHRGRVTSRSQRVRYKVYWYLVEKVNSSIGTAFEEPIGALGLVVAGRAQGTCPQYPAAVREILLHTVTFTSVVGPAASWMLCLSLHVFLSLCQLASSQFLGTTEWKNWWSLVFQLPSLLWRKVIVGPSLCVWPSFLCLGMCEAILFSPESWNYAISSDGRVLPFNVTHIWCISSFWKPKLSGYEIFFLDNFKF